MLRYARLLSQNVFMARKPPHAPLLVVLGATGTGKSQLAVDLAKRFNGEIINGDAMQMYQGLPIVTNKITHEEQQGVPHHLLGFIALDEEPWRVTMFKKRAQEIIKEIRSRGCLPILVGGTHYYTQSLLFKDSSIGPDDTSEVEEVSNQEVSERFPVLDGPTEDMIEQLKVVDPTMAERWHPKDRRKIRRSLEIYLLTGKRASDVYAEQRKRKAATSIAETRDNASSESDADLASTLLLWVHADSEVLKQRLDARVNKMIKSGLSEEVLSMERFLREQQNLGIEVDRGRGIWVSIGWKEFEAYFKALDLGTVSKEKLRNLHELAVEKTKAATRQYAKRQVRWIRLKLLPALAEEQARDRLYLLDGTDVTRWDDDVSSPAIDVADAFLKGLELESPPELSLAARTHLVLDDEQVGKGDSFFQRECAVCNTIVVAEKQWEIHLKSRRHKALIKKKDKKAAQERHSLQDENTPEEVP